MLEGKIIIVTGGCAGIGWGITQACVRHGARVVACQRSESGRARIDALVEEGYSAEFRITDISDPDACAALIAHVMATYGRIDVLINNAGVTIEDDFLTFDLERAELLWRTNLRSVFLLSQGAARHMKDAGGGAILNISSHHSVASVPGYEVYAATKGGIAAMSRAMAWSLGKYGIRVNTLSPGLTLTEAVTDVMNGKPGLDKVFGDLHATGDVATVDDIANIAAFLVSDLAAAIVGADIIADKGVTAQLCRTDDLK